MQSGKQLLLCNTSHANVAVGMTGVSSELKLTIHRQETLLLNDVRDARGATGCNNSQQLKRPHVAEQAMRTYVHDASSQ
eukprot:3814475-Pleurochrysis_carterae.AAC.6